MVSGADDSLVCQWDLRESSIPASVTLAHDGHVNSVAYSPNEAHLLLTGGSDRKAKVWDTRNLQSPVHILQAHSQEVLQVEWAPQPGSILATAAADHRVCLWDLDRSNLKQTPEEAAEGQPELLFVHGGHTDKIAELSFRPRSEEKCPWLIASVAEDNVLQVWEPNPAIRQYFSSTELACNDSPKKHVARRKSSRSENSRKPVPTEKAVPVAKRGKERKKAKDLKLEIVNFRSNEQATWMYWGCVFSATVAGGLQPNHWYRSICLKKFIAQSYFMVRPSQVSRAILLALPWQALFSCACQNT